MRSKTFALSLLLLAACGGGGDGATLSGDAETEFAAIKSTYQQRSFEEASSALDGFLTANPEYTLGWILQGNARREMGLSLSAKEAYNKAIALDPLRFEAYLGLGVLARRDAAKASREQQADEVKAQLRAAKKYYERALSIEPYHAETLSSLAMLLLDLNEEEEALRQAEKAWELTKRDATIAANLSIAYHRNSMTAKRDEARANAERLGYAGLEKLDAQFAASND